MPVDAPEAPDSSAVRVALWRALHLEVDAAPHVFEDDIGARLADPDDDWRHRPDMDPEGTKGFRAGVVARARFVEDLLADQVRAGVRQYVILGAGLDTFAQRAPADGPDVRVFEIDQPQTQAWKTRRLVDLGYGIPDGLTFVPVDFERGEDWDEQLARSPFNDREPALVASMGVSMYLTKEAVADTLGRIASFAPGSLLVMSFLLPLDTIDTDGTTVVRSAERGARSEGTPWMSFFRSDEMLDLAAAAGFARSQHVPGAVLSERYFAHRTDGLRPTHGEDFLLAWTS